MNKFNTLILQKVKYFLPVIILLILGMSTFFFQINQVETDVSCHLDNAHCEFLGINDDMFFDASTFPIEVEELVQFKLKMEKTVVFDSGWVQGINMYMGRIPILPVKSEASLNDELILETFLGSCSEPNMRWQMILNFSDSKGEKFQRFINFETKS